VEDMLGWGGAETKGKTYSCGKTEVLWQTGRTIPSDLIICSLYLSDGPHWFPGTPSQLPPITRAFSTYYIDFLIFVRLNS
jgi:hypothetical protein